MSPRSEALLAIDIGSSSTRVAAVAPDGEVLGVVAAPTPIERPGGGCEEIDVDRVWTVVCGLIVELPTDSLRVRGLAVAALLGTVFFDRRGVPLRPALSWSDTRAAEFASDPSGRQAQLIRQIARRRPTGELLGARLGWLRAEEPELAARVGKVASIKDAILARLSGRLVTDATHASYTGLYDVASRRWSEELCAAAEVDAGLLPKVLSAGEVAGTIEPVVAERLGLPDDAVVAVGAPDGTAGVLGAGAVRPGQTVDIAGTTDVLMRVVADPPDDAVARTVLNAYPVPGLWATGGPTGMTGGAVEWAARLSGFADLASALTAFGEEIERVGPGAGGVTFKTELSGGRFPRWDSASTGTISGLRPEHGPANLFRAAREGAAFTVKEGLDALAGLGSPVSRLIVAGGLARDPSALQMRADIFGIPIEGCVDPQVTILGAAMLAGIAAAVFPSAEAAVRALSPPTVEFTPSGSTVEAYGSVLRERDVDASRPGATRCDSPEARRSQHDPRLGS